MIFEYGLLWCQMRRYKRTRNGSWKLLDCACLALYADDDQTEIVHESSKGKGGIIDGLEDTNRRTSYTIQNRVFTSPCKM